MAIYAIGDIHGCYQELKTLINKLSPNQNDVFIFLGDYVDRGPDSKNVIDWLITFSKKSNSIFIQGNHEILMLSALMNEERLNEWLSSGGGETLKSYKIKPHQDWSIKIPTTHWEFIKNAKPYHQIGNLLFVHAGLESSIPLNKQSKHSLFWKKYVTPIRYSDEETVICGHTSRKNGEIANFGHTICIDTYAYGGQWLTGLNVTTGKYYQINQQRELRIGKIEPVESN